MIDPFPAEHLDLLPRHLSAENAHDMNATLATLTDDFVFDDVAGGRRGLGHAGPDEHYQMWWNAFDNHGTTDQRHISGIRPGNRRVTHWAGRHVDNVSSFWSIARTGRSIDVPVVIVVTIRNGLMAGERFFWDRARPARPARPARRHRPASGVSVRVLLAGPTANGLLGRTTLAQLAGVPGSPAILSHPEHAYRAGMGIMGLARRYGPERFEAACARAVASGAISYSSVKSILAEGLDRLPLPGTQVVPPPPDHDNLRGARYYAGEDGEQCS